MNAREKHGISCHQLWTILQNFYSSPCQATAHKVKSSLVVKEGKTIFLAPKQKHNDNQMLPFHLAVKKVTVLAGGHFAKRSALSLEYAGLDDEKS